MMILTPGGYVEDRSLKPGDHVLAFDLDGTPIVNEVLEAEVQHPASFAYSEPSGDPEVPDTVVVPPMYFYDVTTARGTVRLFQNQSVWVLTGPNEGKVVHASNLVAGDVLWDDADQERPVLSIAVVQAAEWVRFKISGDHSFIADGHSVHNASRYWVGGTGNWDAATTTNWSGSSGGSGGSSVPSSSDDVTFDSLSNATGYTVTVTATANCNDLTLNKPLTGNVTFAGSSTLNISGSLAVDTSNVSRNYTGAINFLATATGKNVSWGVVTWTSTITFNGVGGGWTFQTNFTNATSNKTMTLTNGSLDFNGNTVGYSVSNLNFASSNSNVRSLTLGAATVSIGSWDLTTVTNLTFSGASATINSNGSNTFAGGGQTYGTVNLATAGGFIAGITGANTFGTLTMQSAVLVLSANQVVTTQLTLSGTTGATGRLFVNSNDMTAARTITCNGTVTAQYVDFENIVGAGSASWNLAAITGLSGDCGGNSGITFTAPTTQHWTNASGGNCSTSGNWTSHVPLPQDTALFDKAFGSNQTISVDLPRIGAIDFTGATWGGTLTLSSTIYNPIIMGNVTLIAGMLVASSNDFYVGRRGTTVDLDSKGVSWANILRVRWNTRLTANLTHTNTSGFVVGQGTFDANGFALTCFAFDSIQTTYPRTVTMGSGQWTLTGSGATIWNVSATNLTFNPGSLPIVCNYSGSTGTRTVTTGSPIAAQAASFAVTAGTDTFSAPSLVMNSLDFTGFAGVWAGSGTKNLYGNLTLATGMTFSITGTTLFALASGIQTLTSNGRNMDTAISKAANGTLKLLDALTFGIATARTFTLNAGTFDLNGFNVTQFGTFIMANDSVTKNITFGGGTWELTNTTAVTAWTGQGSNFTTTGSGTIRIAGNTTSTRTFAGGGFTYPTLHFKNTTAAGRLDITGSNTFADLLYNDTVANSIKFTAATTNTFAAWSASGTASNLLTIGSITSATHTLAKTGGGVVSADYLSISYSTATPGSTWYAGTHSTNGGNNSGWSFTAAPLTANTSVSAQVTGHDTSNASRSAEIAGVDTANAQRAAELTGFDVANGSRPAEIFGAVLSTDDHPAEIAGQDLGIVSRSSEIAGQDQSNLGRAAELHGQSDDFADRSAEISGAEGATNDVSAEIHGVDLNGTSIAAAIHGTADDGVSHAAEISGSVTDGMTAAAEMNVQAGAIAVRQAQVHGSIDVAAVRAAEMHGMDSGTVGFGCEIDAIGIGEVMIGCEMDAAIGGQAEVNCQITGIEHRVVQEQADDIVLTSGEEGNGGRVIL